MTPPTLQRITVTAAFPGGHHTFPGTAPAHWSDERIIEETKAMLARWAYVIPGEKYHVIRHEETVLPTKQTPLQND